MKQHLQRLGKFFFLSALMLLISCQNDEPATSTHEGHAHADRNKISMAQFRNETQIKDFKPLAQVPVAQNSTTGKNTAPEDFAIDTVAIKKHIDETGSITYSFRIYPLEADADPSKKFNLVYIKENNVWQTSILSFKANENPSDQNQALYSDLENLYDSRIGGGSNICVTETWSVQCDGSCHGSCDGFNCPTGQCLKRSVSVFSCAGGSGGDTGGGGGGSPNPGSPVTPGGGGNAPVNPYQFTPNMFENPIFDSPEYLRAYRAQSFWETMILMNAQGWASENSSIYLDILNSLLNNYNVENIEFAKQLIQSSIDTGLKLDFEKSLKSPMNVDITAVSGTSPEEVKFNKIYEKLLLSPRFKNLFTNVFDKNDRVNVKFKISNSSEIGGMLGRTTHEMVDGKLQINVAINRQLLLSQTPYDYGSNIILAKVIAHECLHAFIQDIRINSTQHPQISMTALNGMNLSQAIDDYYNIYSNNAEHEFIADKLIPELTAILNEILTQLVPQNEIITYSNTILDYPGAGINESWNWNSFLKNLSTQGLEDTKYFNTLFYTHLPGNEAIIQMMSLQNTSRYFHYIRIANLLSRNLN